MGVGRLARREAALRAARLNLGLMLRPGLFTQRLHEVIGGGIYPVGDAFSHMAAGHLELIVQKASLVRTAEIHMAPMTRDDKGEPGGQGFHGRKIITFSARRQDHDVARSEKLDHIRRVHILADHLDRRETRMSSAQFGDLSLHVVVGIREGLDDELHAVRVGKGARPGLKQHIDALAREAGRHMQEGLRRAVAATDAFIGRQIDGQAGQDRGLPHPRIHQRLLHRADLSQHAVEAPVQQIDGRGRKVALFPSQQRQTDIRGQRRRVHGIVLGDDDFGARPLGGLHKTRDRLSIGRRNLAQVLDRRRLDRNEPNPAGGALVKHPRHPTVDHGEAVGPLDMAIDAVFQIRNALRPGGRRQRLGQGLRGAIGRGAVLLRRQDVRRDPLDLLHRCGDDLLAEIGAAQKRILHHQRNQPNPGGLGTGGGVDAGAQGVNQDDSVTRP
ncbi:hypothetical protein D3C73_418540 [compost metagenome]